jgi:hypothetical protein
MNLEGKRVLILGGSGLVGLAVARRLFASRPARITLVGLYDEEVRRAAAALEAERGETAIDTAWGDVFLPAAVAKMPRRDVLASAQHRALVLQDLLGEMNDAVLRRSFLFQLFDAHRPDAVVDCINTATAFAYQDVFQSARRLLDAAREGPVTREMVEDHVLTIPTPQLIRHLQIVVETMKRAGTSAYVKVGTSGTGGMGFNVPYTHSEERPSRTLMTKSAVAGAHSLLLFLMGRTPGAPATVEIKPTAAIAWRDVCFGPVKRRGAAIRMFDCVAPLPVDHAFASGAAGWRDTGRVLESVFADVGENGYFAREEFETVTALGQMEFITPQEVADYVVLELQGRPTGRDVVSALDAVTAGPTYKAGLLRATAMERLEALERRHGVRSVAFEMLGPPRLTKLLYETYVWSRLCASVRALAESIPVTLSQAATELLAADAGLRSTILSVGLPVIVPGRKVYRGEEVIVPPVGGDVERAVVRGWVDVRPESCAIWIARAARMLEQARARAPGGGSDAEWDPIRPDDPIRPARFATWIFRYEDGGERIKR